MTNPELIDKFKQAHKEELEKLIKEIEKRFAWKIYSYVKNYNHTPYDSNSLIEQTIPIRSLIELLKPFLE